MSGIARIVGVAGVLCLAWGASARAQAVRDVGTFNAGAGSNFHGTLGTNALQGFTNYSSGTPGQGATGGYASPDTSANGLLRRNAGGIGENYRITSGMPADSASLSRMIRYGPSNTLAVPAGAGPIGPVINPGAAAGMQLPYLAAPPTNPLAGGGLQMGPVGSASPTDAGQPFGPQTDAAGRPVPFQDNFDLPTQLKANANWRQGVELLKGKQYPQAAQEFRLGLVFSPNRAEGQWLMALAQAAAGDYGDTVFRLRNALAINPVLLTKPRGADGLLDRGWIDEFVRSVESAVAAGMPVDAEKLLTAAWLAVEAGQPARVQPLLSKASGLAAAGTTVAAALGQAAGVPAVSGPSGAGGPSPQAAGGPAAGGLSAAGPAQSLTQWLGERGPLLGYAPREAQLMQGEFKPAPR